MKYVTPSLKSGAQGKEVDNLNNCLVFYLDKEERIFDLALLNLGLTASQVRDLLNQNIEQYGPFTESLIKSFQKNNLLGETGEVNQETADKLNVVLNNIGAFNRLKPDNMSWRPPNAFRDHVLRRDIVRFNIDSQQGRGYNPINTEQQVREIASKSGKSERAGKAHSSNLLRLSIKDGEYTYAKADDIIMIESSDHITIVHVAQQVGQVKTTIRSCSLKDFLSDLPENAFLRVNRFCAINLNRLSGSSYHQQFFEFDYCIRVKPKHPLSHAILNSIGK